MNRARYFGEACGDLRRQGLSNVPLALHSDTPGNDLAAAYATDADADPFVPTRSGVHPKASFDQFTGNSGIYYACTWSMSIATDLFKLRTGAPAQFRRGKALKRRDADTRGL